MKNIILVSVAVIILVAVGFVLFKQKSAPLLNLPIGRPTNFNLVFKYGVGAKNELNTFDQTFTKDMVMDPSVTVKMKLSDNELNSIYQKINNLNFIQ
jgi:hypothetical protein